MIAAILAAGMGNRLGNSLPKPLTPLADGKSILARQVDMLGEIVGRDRIYVVVGFKKELLMEALPDLAYVYNSHFNRENTAKSLLRCLRKLDADVLWTNGDVVCTPAVLRSVVEAGRSCMAVTVGPTGEEEVKYELDERGRIGDVSKEVKNAPGEAVGINLVTRADRDRFCAELERCGPQDYFERGIAAAIAGGMEVHPVHVDVAQAVEVDFPADLVRANALISQFG